MIYLRFVSRAALCDIVNSIIAKEVIQPVDEKDIPAGKVEKLPLGLNFEI